VELVLGKGYWCFSTEQIDVPLTARSRWDGLPETLPHLHPVLSAGVPARNRSLCPAQALPRCRTTAWRAVLPL